MPVKVRNLWLDGQFRELDYLTQLLYIHLVTNPTLSSVGVMLLDIPQISLNLNKAPEGELRKALVELRKQKFINPIRGDDGKPYLIIPDHFKTVPKSDSSVLKITRDLDKLPQNIVDELAYMGITIDRKVVQTKKPTAEEVSSYALEHGYLIDGQEFVDFYEDCSQRHGKKDVWVDGRGQVVRDWRAKLRKVWFKPDKRFNIPEGAPKGFEAFSIIVQEPTTGKVTRMFPNKWVDGLPQHPNFGVDRTMKKEFKEQNAKS